MQVRGPVHLSPPSFKNASELLRPTTDSLLRAHAAAILNIICCRAALQHRSKPKQTPGYHVISSSLVCVPFSKNTSISNVDITRHEAGKLLSFSIHFQQESCCSLKHAIDEAIGHVYCIPVSAPICCTPRGMDSPVNRAQNLKRKCGR